MRFFKGTDGQYYPVSDIIWIGKEREIKTRNGSSKVHHIKLEKGSEAEIWSYQLDEIIAERGSYIPALPGTYMLHGCDDASVDDDPIFKSNVIGWRITNSGQAAEPVTADGVNDGLSGWCTILMPDGSVTIPGNQTWATYDAWEADRRKEWDERRAKVADEAPSE